MKYSVLVPIQWTVVHRAAAAPRARQVPDPVAAAVSTEAPKAAAVEKASKPMTPNWFVFYGLAYSVLLLPFSVTYLFFFVQSLILILISREISLTAIA